MSSPADKAPLAPHEAGHVALNGVEIPRTAREERTCPAYWTVDLCTILDLYLVLGLNCSITRGADAHACLTMVRHSQSVRNAPKGLETTAGTDWKLERPESMQTCLTMPSASMRATPMPALPAPTSTMRCWASSLLLLPCTRSAPYTPATAVAAVPCKRNGSVLMPEQDLCFCHIQENLTLHRLLQPKNVEQDTHRLCACLPSAAVTASEGI